MINENEIEFNDLTEKQLKILETEIQNYIAIQKKCIECGNEFFHKQGCQRGRGLSPSKINHIIKICIKRAFIINQRYCEFCELPAKNTYYKLYHQTIFNGEPALLTWYYLCGSCTGEADELRPMGIFPSVVSSEYELKELLKKVLRVNAR